MTPDTAMAAPALGRQRLRLAGLLIVAMMLVLPLMTITTGSRDLFRVATFLELLFVVACLPVIGSELRTWASGWVGRTVAAGFVVVIVGWQLLVGPAWEVDRTWLYLVLPLFLAALVGWFRIVGLDGLQLLYRAKVLVVVAAIIWICVDAYLRSRGVIDGVPGRAPPVFRHIRHLNYEIPIVALLGLAFYARSGKLGQPLILLSFLAFGYYSAWSGGRGQLLSMLVAALALVASTGWRGLPKATLPAVLLFLVGALAVLAADQTSVVATTLRHSTAESAGYITSGRSVMWQQILDRCLDSGPALLVGHGPDAYARLDWPTAFGASSRQWGFAGTVQPHNTLLLWLIEFGALGTVLLLLLALLLMARCIGILRQAGAAESPRIVAALLIGYASYAMTDGIAYHSMPMLFVTALTAYLMTVGGMAATSRAPA